MLAHEKGSRKDRGVCLYPPRHGYYSTPWTFMQV
nr:MAG TPA: hypothetical protein [Caudoviricetes sp.]DAY67872.1 MAG TPA: hypothetical protein [Caudoviricetes sp.]DAZ59818.1 MAG TPA: hypothetical protein [Caudoviricetes sp.]